MSILTPFEYRIHQLEVISAFTQATAASNFLIQVIESVQGSINFLQDSFLDSDSPLNPPGPTAAAVADSSQQLASIPPLQSAPSIPSVASFSSQSPMVDDPAVMHVTANQHSAAKPGLDLCPYAIMPSNADMPNQCFHVMSGPFELLSFGYRGSVIVVIRKLFNCISGSSTAETWE